MKTILCLGTAIVIFAALTPLAHALDGHPAWNTQINNPGRFKVLTQFDRDAVFDKETGLVWMKSPSTVQRSWVQAHMYCNRLTLGNRKGWRLPTIQELTSLLDPTEWNPSLPDGHPFTDVQSEFYWSATASNFETTRAWGVSFDYGNPDPEVKLYENYVWCVRGGQGVDPQ